VPRLTARVVLGLTPKHGRDSVDRRTGTSDQEETMGAEENVAIMQRAYDAFNSADMDTLIELFDESCVWHLPGRSSMANDYQGRDATLAYFGQIGQETGGTFQAELQQLFAGDDGRVIGLQRSTAERDGKALDVGNCIVFELKDGKVVDGREHFNDLYAWDEFWS
jgi:ketosteroid isomerase-like protein